MALPPETRARSRTSRARCIRRSSRASSTSGRRLKVAVAAMAILLFDLLIPLKYSKHLAWAAIVACLLPLGDIAHHYEEKGSLFLGMTAMDLFASFFKAFFLIGSIPVILLSYISKQLEGVAWGSTTSFLLSSVFGGMPMASSTHFLMLFLSLEILSVCSYILVGYVRNDRRGAEAALKDIIDGSIAVAIMAYGFSLWFGLTGSGEIRNLAACSGIPRSRTWTRTPWSSGPASRWPSRSSSSSPGSPQHVDGPHALLGAGRLRRLPTPVTAFLSVISKAAGFAISLRFFQSLASSIENLESGNAVALERRRLEADADCDLHLDDGTLGNFAALWQTNLKRLMAYSLIAHAGYLMMGLTLLGTAAQYGGKETITFYLLAYLAMNFGAFAVVILIENRLGSVDVGDYAGIGRRAPYLAFALTVFLFSLIGVPPTAGFMGKLHLLMGVVDLGRILESKGDPQAWAYYLLALAAIANTAVSAYYYLKVAKAMYFERAGSVEELRSPLVGHAVVTAMLRPHVLSLLLCRRHPEDHTPPGHLRMTEPEIELLEKVLQLERSSFIGYVVEGSEPELHDEFDRRVFAFYEDWARDARGARTLSSRRSRKGRKHRDPFLPPRVLAVQLRGRGLPAPGRNLEDGQARPRPRGPRPPFGGIRDRARARVRDHRAPRDLPEGGPEARHGAASAGAQAATDQGDERLALVTCSSPSPLPLPLPLPMRRGTVDPGGLRMVATLERGS